MIDLDNVVTLGVVFVVAITFGWGFLTQKLKASEWKKKFTKIQHDKISSEVRVGKIGENMAPFLTGWPYNPNTFRFLGNPVDGIQFNKNEIIFVEIKTGKSKLSKGQKHLKSLVKEGKVSFATFRVGEDGCDFRIEENDV